VHSLGTAPVLPLARLAGRRVLFHIHGQEWKGGKWGPRARAYFKWCEKPALRYAGEVVVNSRASRDTGILAELGLAPRGYLLFVGRLVPEKGCHHLLEAHRRLGLDLPVVVVGDSAHSDDYARTLRAGAGPAVRFAGVVTGDRLTDLYARSLLLVNPTERDAVSLVLLEAMGQGACVLASDIPEMLEGVGGAGYHFRQGQVADLAAQLRRLLDDPAAVEAVRAAAAARVGELYGWGPVTDQFEAVYRRLVA
jgi:glycosyltransferase involved in cell wall biosynthesis